MKLAWLQEEFNKRVIGSVHPTAIFMGYAAFQDYVATIAGKGYGPIEQGTFNGAVVIPLMSLGDWNIVLGDLVSVPEDSRGVGAHEWTKADIFQWEFCRRCGVVRRSDDCNKPCRGDVRLRPMEEPLRIHGEWSDDEVREQS